MEHRKILFFDIDGTLTDDQTGQVPPSTMRAIQQARALGHLAFVNSGRPITTIPQEVIDIGFDGFVCGCGTYIDYLGEILFNVLLSHEECQDIVKHLIDGRIDALLEGSQGIYICRKAKHPTVERIYQIYKYHNGFDVKDEDDPHICFDKFAIWYDENSDYEPFYQRYKDQFEFIDRGPGMREVVPHGISKASGIQFLLDYFHIDMEDCYAFGDSSNDLSMLTYVKHSIGMQNGEPQVLEKVSYITTNSKDDGIEHALKHFHII